MRIFGLSTRASAYLSIGYNYMDMDSSTGASITFVPYGRV